MIGESKGETEGVGDGRIEDSKRHLRTFYINLFRISAYIYILYL